MAQIDVTDVLSDPDFIDPVSIIDRVPTVNLYGENIVQETATQTVGSVQPADGRVLQRLPEALRVANLSSFWVRGQIVASAPGKYTSVIVFKGKRYQVQTIFDWTNWGQGWCEGTCVAEVP